MLSIHGTPSGATTSDNLNGAWTRDLNYLDGKTSTRSGLWRLANTAGGSPSITYTPNGTNAGANLVIMEFTGISTTSPYDGQALGEGTGGTSLSSGSYTPSQASVLLIGTAYANASGSDPDAAWTNVLDDNFAIIDYREVSSVAAYTHTAVHTSGSYSWQSTLTAYKVATSSYKRLGLLGVG